MVTKDDVVKEIVKRALLEDTRIEMVKKLNGGWEGWAQVELALFINAEPEQPIGGPVIREVPAYQNNHWKADLSIGVKAPSKTGWIVELKCFNQYYDLEDPKNHFEKNLKGDVEKAKNRKGNFKDEGYLVVGIIYGKDVAKMNHDDLTSSDKSWESHLLGINEIVLIYKDVKGATT